MVAFKGQFASGIKSTMAFVFVPEIWATPSHRPVRISCAVRDDAEHPHSKKISVMRIIALNISTLAKGAKAAERLS